jgi:drug/metabolite transporter (DMT)-like permease
LLGAFFFSFASIIGKFILNDGMHPFVLTLLQYLFIVILLLFWHYWKVPSFYKEHKAMMPKLALQGIIGSAGINLFFYAALQHLDAGIAAMLLFIHPVYITLYFAVTKKKIIGIRHYASLLLVILGGVITLDLIFGLPEELSIVGIFRGVMAGMCYAFYNVFADLHLKEVGANTINLFGSFFGLILTLLLIAISNIPFNFQFSVLPPIVLLSCLSGILPIYFIFKALKHIGSEKVSIVAALELPITLLLAFIFLGEQMKTSQLIGVLMIVASSVLLQYKGNQKSEACIENKK